MVELADEIVKEEARATGVSFSVLQPFAIYFVNLSLFQEKQKSQKADSRFAPILLALAENPKWFHIMKHAAELSSDFQQLSGLNLEGPEAECLRLLSNVARQVNDDEALRDWLQEIESYIDDAYKNSSLRKSADFRKRGEEIAHSMHALKKRLKKRTDIVQLFSQIRGVVDSFSADNDLSRFYSSCTARDLCCTSSDLASYTLRL